MMWGRCGVDLVVAAALDAVKENVEVPWRTTREKEGVKVVEVSSETAASVAPDATSSDTPVPGTQTTTVEPASKPANSPTTASIPSSTPPYDTSSTLTPPTPASFTRTLSERHFARALKEITPSASEALGTLSDLRKWNAEFGGGERKKSNKAWGGRFGFGGSGKKDGREEGSGRVGGIVP